METTSLTKKLSELVEDSQFRKYLQSSGLKITNNTLLHLSNKFRLEFNIFSKFDQDNLPIIETLSDLTSDLPIDDVSLMVANPTTNELEPVQLKDLLKEFGKYFGSQNDSGDLYQYRDLHIVASCKAFMVPPGQDFFIYGGQNQYKSRITSGDEIKWDYRYSEILLVSTAYGTSAFFIENGKKQTISLEFNNKKYFFRSMESREVTFHQPKESTPLNVTTAFGEIKIIQIPIVLYQNWTDKESAMNVPKSELPLPNPKIYADIRDLFSMDKKKIEKTIIGIGPQMKGEFKGFSSVNNIHGYQRNPKLPIRLTVLAGMTVSDPNYNFNDLERMVQEIGPMIKNPKDSGKMEIDSKRPTDPIDDGIISVPTADLKKEFLEKNKVWESLKTCFL